MTGQILKVGHIPLIHALNQIADHWDAIAVNSPGWCRVEVVECRECDRPYVRDAKLHNMFYNVRVCDACCKKLAYDSKVDSLKNFWKNFCPLRYANTNIDHPDFNRAAYDYAKTFPLNTNFIFTGGPDTSKTRIGFHLLKLALLKDIKVARYFPEDVEEKDNFVTTREHIQRMTYADIVLFDNLLDVGAASEKLAKMIGRIIDARVRSGKSTYITTSIAASDLDRDANKYGTMTKVEWNRVKTIQNRLEGFTTIDCDHYMEVTRERQSGKVPPEDLF